MLPLHQSPIDGARRILLGEMLGRLAILLTVLGLGLLPSSALASSQDVASTHTYLTAGYTVLHTAVDTWSTVEANIHKLQLKYDAECPDVGAGSPQNEAEQKLSYEVAGALWSTGYHTDAAAVQKFVAAIKPLKWSNASITRSAHNLARGLHEMAVLQVPDLCGDVRAWNATGFTTIPASTLSFDQHVEAIEVKEIAWHLLSPYVQPAEKGLLARDEALATQFEHLETERGFNDWDSLLETLALNQ
jgi:hypothetical protein